MVIPLGHRSAYCWPKTKHFKLEHIHETEYNVSLISVVPKQNKIKQDRSPPMRLLRNNFETLILLAITLSEKKILKMV